VTQHISLSGSIGTRLSAAELDAYTQRGWTGPFPLLDAQGVAELTAAIVRSADYLSMPAVISPGIPADAFLKRPWFKSAHAYLPEIYDVATHPAVVSRVRSILGDDVLLWGSGPVLKLPGKRHPWHVDVEHKEWDGVSVFLGLNGTSRDASLRILEGSHRLAQDPDEAAVKSDEQAVAASQENGGSGVIAEVDMGEGEFFIFAGRAWHSSHNRSPNPRVSVILQYARPEAMIRIPLNFKVPIQWHGYPPPCVLASGVDNYHVNTLVGRPKSPA
jgi:hypothetical protein